MSILLQMSYPNITFKFSLLRDYLLRLQSLFYYKYVIFFNLCHIFSRLMRIFVPNILSARKFATLLTNLVISFGIQTYRNSLRFKVYRTSCYKKNGLFGDNCCRNSK